MTGGIDFIQTMRQHTHRLIAIVHRFLMGTDIHAVGQSADDEHLRAHLLQISDKMANQVHAIGGTMTSAHDIDNTALVQVSRSHVIHQDGRIGTLSQALRITLITQQQRLNMVLRNKVHLLSSACQRQRPVFQALCQAIGTLRQHILDIQAMLIDGLSTTQLTIEPQRRLEVEARHAGQGNSIIDFLFVHAINFSNAAS